MELSGKNKYKALEIKDDAMEVYRETGMLASELLRSKDNWIIGYSKQKGIAKEAEELAEGYVVSWRQCEKEKAELEAAYKEAIEALVKAKKLNEEFLGEIGHDPSVGIDNRDLVYSIEESNEAIENKINGN